MVLVKGLSTERLNAWNKVVELLGKNKSDVWNKNFLKTLTLCLMKMCLYSPQSLNSPLPFVYGYLEKQTLIHLAATKGHNPIIKALIGCTDNPNAPDNNKRTPIHYAAMNGHCEVVKTLTAKMKNPNAPDDRGQTPIHYAAKNGKTIVMKFLMAYTDNPIGPDDWNRTPIYLAAQNGHAEVVRILVACPSTIKPNSPGLGKAI